MALDTHVQKIRGLRPDELLVLCISVLSPEVNLGYHSTNLDDSHDALLEVLVGVLELLNAMPLLQRRDKLTYNWHNTDVENFALHFCMLRLELVSSGIKRVYAGLHVLVLKCLCLIELHRFVERFGVAFSNLSSTREMEQLAEMQVANERLQADWRAVREETPAHAQRASACA